MSLLTGGLLEHEDGIVQQSGSADVMMFVGQRAGRLTTVVLGTQVSILSRRPNVTIKTYTL